jgi:hypothetical protein
MEKLAGTHLTLILVASFLSTWASSCRPAVSKVELLQTNGGHVDWCHATERIVFDRARGGATVITIFG